MNPGQRICKFGDKCRDIANCRFAHGPGGNSGGGPGDNDFGLGPNARNPFPNDNRGRGQGKFILD
jgi:hypothetical protein